MNPPRKVKKFLIVIVVFFIPVFCFLGYTELALREYRNTYDQKKEFIDQRADSIRILVLGDSHAHNGIDPTYLGKGSFNLANDGQSLYYDIKLTEKYLNKLTNLKCVIIPLSYFTFYYRMENSFAEPRQYNYYHTFGISPAAPLSVFDINRYSYIASYTPRISFGIVFLNRFKADSQAENGFLASFATLPADVDQKMVLEKFGYHREIIQNGNLESNLSLLNEFLTTLSSRNIEAIFITLPVSSVYKTHLDPEVERRNREIITQFCVKFNLEYFDLDSSSALGNDYFSDIDHLNVKGAALVSSRLSSLLNKNEEWLKK